MSGFLVAVVVFYGFGLQHELSFEALKASRQALDNYREIHPVGMAAAFFLVYVAVAALSLPFATPLALAGGAAFGLVEAVVLVSFASSIGATLAFLASRLLFRDAVQRRFGPRLRTVNEGVQREGARYLLALRLVPAVPFFLVNVLVGLTAMPVRTFYFVSQLGMLPATVVYVNAGTQLANLQSASGLLSSKLLGALVLLAALPMLTRAGVARLTVRRRYARWPKPERFDRNLVVIGAGSAGLVSAYVAATVGASVTLVEQHAMGGDCLNTGCVPSKAFIHSARLAAQARNAATAGVHVDDVRVHFQGVMQHVHDAIRAIAPHDSEARFRALGVDVQRGHARIVTPWVVEIDGVPIRTRAIVIASGSEPVIPLIRGLQGADYLTPDTLWQLRELPGRLTVLGGGPTGCELAQAFARLGSHVTLVEAADRLLVAEDEEVSAMIRARLMADGVDVRTRYRALAVDSDCRDLVLACETGADHVRLVYDRLLIAVGRKPRTEGLGLEELGIPAAHPVTTDRYLATLYPNVYACGDVAGPYFFAHTAAHQAWYASVNALFWQVKRFRADRFVIPSVIFVDPEVARAGINQRQAMEQGLPFEVTRYDFDNLDRAITENDAHGYIQVLTPPGKDTILGVTIVGQHAGELLAEFVLAMQHGLGLNKMLGTIHAYPTWAEANARVAASWKRTHVPQRMLAVLARYHAWRRN